MVRARKRCLHSQGICSSTFAIRSICTCSLWHEDKINLKLFSTAVHVGAMGHQVLHKVLRVYQFIWVHHPMAHVWECCKLTTRCLDTHNTAAHIRFSVAELRYMPERPSPEGSTATSTSGGPGSSTTACGSGPLASASSTTARGSGPLASASSTTSCGSGEVCSCPKADLQVRLLSVYAHQYHVIRC